MEYLRAKIVNARFYATHLLPRAAGYLPGVTAGSALLDEATVDERLAGLERRLREIEPGGKLYGHLFDDVLALKYLHQRYTNYLRWLTQ